MKIKFEDFKKNNFKINKKKLKINEFFTENKKKNYLYYH